MKYAVGVDFGTLSARALVVEVATGKELEACVSPYAHAVMDAALPDGKKLPPDFALQHPRDYLDSLKEAVTGALAASKVSPGDIIGVGLGFSACTMLPLDKDGTPLCLLPEYEGNPHAYVKLWKHHAAQEEATRINELAEARGESFLKRYGGKISSEWMLPKAWQILNEAPDVYAAADLFIEGGDWVIAQLTGNVCRNSCMAGYKAMWHKREGYPSRAFLQELDPRLATILDDKLRGQVYPQGAKAGEVTARGAALSGLPIGCAVAVSNVDAHVSLPAVGIVSPGKMLMIMGTSTCHMVMGDEEKIVPGMCGAVEDGILEGFIGFEAGQSCVGDHFDWFARGFVPAAYQQEAKERGLPIQSLLTEKAERLAIGESGLIALDWWNGNRSVLVDADLTGVLVGMTLATRPEEIYRALIEATAFGTRMIIDTFAKNGVPVDELYACGGITAKNPMMMQIYADVTGREIRLSRSEQAPSLGSAMFGAVAAGAARGGHDSIEDAARAMGGVKELSYKPIAENVKKYEALYREYAELHDYFGRGGSDVLKRLKDIKRNA